MMCRCVSCAIWCVCFCEVPSARIAFNHLVVIMPARSVVLVLGGVWSVPNKDMCAAGPNWRLGWGGVWLGGTQFLNVGFVVVVGRVLFGDHLVVHAWMSWCSDWCHGYLLVACWFSKVTIMYAVFSLRWALCVIGRWPM